MSIHLNADGSCTLNDPQGNLAAAYQMRNYALILQAAKNGPTHDVPVLVTVLEKGNISTATWAGKEYNYMQFRTSSGGMELGSAILDAHGTVSISLALGRAESVRGCVPSRRI